MRIPKVICVANRSSSIPKYRPRRQRSSFRAPTQPRRARAMVRTPETDRTLDQVCSGTKDKPEVVKVSESGLGSSSSTRPPR